jgi:hypothetical protein
MTTQFWNLTDCGIEKRLADMPEGGEIQFEEVHCPIEPKRHFRLGNRISPLDIVLPEGEPEDFVWVWGGECLVQEHVLFLFKREGFTGYKPVPVRSAVFAHSSKKPPQFWDIAITGSAGMASPESGTRVLRVCPACGSTDYSRVTNSANLIDVGQWDGSDFFRLKPVEGFIFVTDRVIQALRKNALTGWKARSLAEIQDSLDRMIP